MCGVSSRRRVKTNRQNLPRTTRACRRYACRRAPRVAPPAAESRSRRVVPRSSRRRGVRRFRAFFQRARGRRSRRPCAREARSPAGREAARLAPRKERDERRRSFERHPPRPPALSRRPRLCRARRARRPARAPRAPSRSWRTCSRAPRSERASSRGEKRRVSRGGTRSASSLAAATRLSPARTPASPARRTNL